MLIILSRQQAPLELAAGTPINAYRLYNTYTRSSSGPCLELRGVDSINAFTRAMQLAEGFARQLLPPVPIAETE